MSYKKKSGHQYRLDRYPIRWNKVKDNAVTIRFRNSVTKEEVTGFKDNSTWSRKWYPVHANGDYIQGLHATDTKEEMEKQLEDYLISGKKLSRMNIKDRMKAIKGVTDVGWNSQNLSLTIYYDGTQNAENIKLKVLTEINRANLQEAIKTVNFYSV